MASRELFKSVNDKHSKNVVFHVAQWIVSHKCFFLINLLTKELKINHQFLSQDLPTAQRYLF